LADIAVIVVNYGVAGLAIDAVESALRARAGDRGVEVHLVDNASPGGDAAQLAAAADERGWGGRVTLWLESENHGFGRGNNRVLEALARRPEPPEYVFLLNPDAQVDPDALAVLAAFLDAHPDVAVAGCRIEKPDGTPVTAAFRFPSLAGEFAAAACFGPVSRLFSGREVALSPLAPTGAVDWVSGAAMMARFRAIAALGFFDPAYFLYYEEVDLMRRAARAGWRTWYVAEARATHAEGAATGVGAEGARRRRPAYWYESWRLYFTRNHGRGYAFACGCAALAGALVNRALAPLLRRRPAAPLHYAGDLWRGGMRPILTGEAAPRHG
jgi:GT2 family glycosyltransferase